MINKNLHLYNMDCMELMAKYPDKHFDLAIVDPPYGNKLKRNKSIKMYLNLPPSDLYFQELSRVSKNQIIWGVNYFGWSISNRGGCVIWNKLGTDTERRTQAPTMSEAEIASQSFNSSVKIFSYAWIGNVVGNNYEINPPEFKYRIHPSQKPVKLYKWLLTNYAKEGDKILDTHLGSGTHAVACQHLGFDLTACELDEDYFKAMLKFVEENTAQYKLL